MAQNPTQPESPTPDAPDALKAELRAMYGRPVEVRDSVDDAVRAAARRAFAEPVAAADQPTRTGVIYRITAVLAAAAALGLVLILSGVFTTGDESQPAHLADANPQGNRPRPELAGDVNIDGRINIVDAYLLQRRIERRDALESQWDLTGDGKVDANDVRAIAAAAVRIQRVSLSPLPPRKRVAESNRGTRPGEDEGDRITNMPGVRGESLVSTLTPALSLEGRGGMSFVQADAPIRFTTYDIIIDTKDAPLAVYQVDISASEGDVQITGIEGGEHEAFKAPPYYDPQAMQQSHVILAAFNTADADKLPRGKVRVATLHVQITGDAEPKFELKLDAAATVEGKAIEATVTLQAKRTQL